MTNSVQWEAASDAVRQAASVLVVTHMKPDGDAIGSLLGMSLALQALGKKVTAAVDGGVPDFLRYLEGSKQVREKLKSGKWDLMISVDASDEERSGLVGVYGRKHAEKVINLDHHPTNTMFGDIFLVVPEAVSASEVIYEWLKYMDIPISQPIATALLTGLVTDTMGFRTSNVKPRTLGLAEALMLAGAPLLDITDRTLVKKPFSTLDLWKQVFPSVTLKDGIVSAVVTQENLKEARLVEMTDGGLVSLLLTAEEALIAVVFKELPENRVEISFRSQPGIDVATVAFGLGGGGHKQASGVTVAGTLDEVQARVMPLLQAILAQGVLA